MLVVSFVGYKNEEIPVAGKFLKITLKEDSKALEEVVVIGYGSARKSDVTGSIASVGGEKLREMPATKLHTLCRTAWQVWICRRLLPHGCFHARSVSVVPVSLNASNNRWRYRTESPL